MLAIEFTTASHPEWPTSSNYRGASIVDTGHPSKVAFCIVSRIVMHHRLDSMLRNSNGL